MKPSERPLFYVGFDYFEPIAVRVYHCTMNRWIVLFTCLPVRHFIGRKRKPVEIHSDRGTNIVRANDELRSVVNRQLSVSSVTLTSDGFSNRLHPHLWAMFEVRSVKTAISSGG